MHPKIKYYLDNIQPHYQSVNDVDKAVDLLSHLGATPMQAFIILHEELGIDEDLADQKIAARKDWTEPDSATALMEVFLYSRYKRNPKKK